MKELITEIPAALPVTLPEHNIYDLSNDFQKY